MRWDSKYTFILSRALLAIIGVARTVAVVRILPLSDYALIGVVEAVRNVIGTLLGFGVGDSLSREGAAERDPRRKGHLLAVSYVNGLVLNLAAGLAFILVALFSEHLYDDPRVPEMLAVAFAVSVLERLWLLSLAALRVFDNHRAFLLFGFVYGVLNAVLTVTLVTILGVGGYFYAQIATGSLLVTLVLVVIIRGTVLPGLRELIDGWRQTTAQLWGVSWFMYMFKGSTTLWRRLPILISAPFAAPQVLGAVSAALDLGFKIQLLHQALSPLIIPRLTRACAESKQHYARVVRSELLEVIALNLTAFIIAVLSWRWVGAPLLTPERWSLIGDLFYLALMVEATLVVANISWMCVLVPTKQLDGVCQRPRCSLQLCRYSIC
jgi:O-antigen/teichoic acid export membrane protein